jgi:acetylornithine deacetylase/succinyl-diaminopimelate desuccinylase-like protein
MHDIYAWVDARADALVDELRDYLRVVSISAQKIGLEEGAAATVDLMRASGIGDARSIPTDGGPAVVFGTLNGAQEKTLLCYAHYDVQPPEPLNAWSSPPFAAEMHDGLIIARGATDDKSGLLAFVKAAQAFRETRGMPPISLKFLFEGEEEVGSPHLDRWVQQNAELIHADAMHCLDGGVDAGTGRPKVALGNKAILYVELRCRGAAYEIHSADAAWVTNPAWRLVRALTTLVDEQTGRILVDGWYDDYSPPTAEDIEWLERALEDFDLEQKLETLGVSALPDGKTPLELLTERCFGPTCTICGFHAGYTGPGGKTAVPPSAFCKLDFRCPPYMEPSEQLEKLQRHLAEKGFPDIEVHVITARPNPWRIPVSAEIAQAVIRAAGKTFGRVPVVHGVTAEAVIIKNLPIPTVLTGFGPMKPNLHAPNENISVEEYLRGIKYAATIMEEFALGA